MKIVGNIETRNEPFSGSGKKPVDFALIETSNQGEGNTYPRYTKVQLKDLGWIDTQAFIDQKVKYNKMRIKQLKRQKATGLYSDYRLNMELAYLESISYKWVKFFYSIK